MLDVGAIAALTTVGLTILLAQSRIFYAMAHDGLLPSIFARVHHRTLTPWVSIVICGTHLENHISSRYFLTFFIGSICAFMSGICPIDILGELGGIGALITYICVHVCVIVVIMRDLLNHRISNVLS